MGAATLKFCAYMAVTLAQIALGSFKIMATSTSNITTSPIDMSTAILIRVDQSGNGDYTKIQDAIDSVPPNNSELVFIWVKPGTYRLVLHIIFKTCMMTIL